MQPAWADTLDTPIGRIELDQGLPATAETVQRIYDAPDVQHASQAYIWGLPIVSFAHWPHSARTALDTRDTDVVLYLGHRSPGSSHEGNRIPAPAGPYSLVARVYGPAPEILSGTWKLPHLEPVAANDGGRP